MLPWLLIDDFSIIGSTINNWIDHYGEILKFAKDEVASKIKQWDLQMES